MKKLIEIALCLNQPEEAKVLGYQFLDLGFEVKVHICKSFSEFADCIAKNKINCFVFDLDYNRFNALEVAEKIRKTPMFCRSSIIFVTDESNKDLPFKYHKINVDMTIPRPLLKENYAEKICEVWGKLLEKLIPEDLRVLVLDNNPNVLEVIGMHLEQLDHKNFVTCQSVKEAKSMMESKEFDMLLLDWDLEDGTCIELIELIRNQSRSQRLKEALTIVITGRNDVSDIMTLVDMDVNDHIIKPFDYNEFQDKISYALHKHKKRQATL